MKTIVLNQCRLKAFVKRDQSTIINATKIYESSDVYDMYGRKVRSKETSLEGLPHGVYNKKKDR